MRNTVAETSSPPVHVAAAAIRDADGRILISRRQQGTHLGGYWEFPGGKLEPGENAEAALYRELYEELHIEPRACRPLIRVPHAYPDKAVILDVWLVTAWDGEPVAREGQAIRWQYASDLQAEEFPAADVPVIQALNLPDRLLITGAFADAGSFRHKLEHALSRGIRHVQLRLKDAWLAERGRDELLAIVECASRLCERHQAGLVLNLPEGVLTPALEATGHRAGIHLDSRRLATTLKRPEVARLSASCHSAEELKQAQALGADYGLLSPVKPTRSHPDTAPLGWQRFSEIIAGVAMPVFALGGVAAKDLDDAWAAGAQGVAAISAFWDADARDRFP